MFDPTFSFTDTNPIPSRNIIDTSNVAPPVRRLVDSLIDKYRQEESTDADIEDLNLKQTDQNKRSQGKSSHNLTDVIRDKPLLHKKTKVDADKYVFKHAVDKYQNISSFLDFKLSKQLLKALTEMSLDKPMPVQCACIPVALMNHDICACARTGSGKTLAFILPILERLTRKPTMGRTVTRALVISPTRELAVQIFKVTEKLVKYCPKIRIQLAAGGLDLHSQEASLRQNPDLVIATPGRLIDHLSNAPSFSLHQIEYLVLDEADKLLDEYFVEQIGEVVRHCGKQRQTLLFSATMTESVKELTTLSLKDPVQVFLNQTTALAKRLQQEFVRVRLHREEDRQAMLVALLLRNFRHRTIVFLSTKKECHKMHILLSLLGLRCAELHGDMTQAQRLEALRRFSEHIATEDEGVGASAVVGLGEENHVDVPKQPPVDILLATDLVARGLDIPDVQTVINYNLPKLMKNYVHRVGRTARAAKGGRAVSLVGETDRKLLKQIMKEAPYPIQARVIPPEIIARYNEKLIKLGPIVERIISTEAEERELHAAQVQLSKAERLLNEGVPTKKNQVGAERQRVDWFVERKRRLKSEARGSKKVKQSQKRSKPQSDEDSD